MKSAEIYGFVGWISSFILFLLYILWAFLPDETLHSFEIYYYPDKTWALVIPSVFCMTIIVIFVGYQSLNMISTNNIDNISNFTDKYTKFKPSNETMLTDSLPEVYDLPINVVNNAIFYQRQRDIRENYNKEKEFNLFRNKSFT